MEKLSQPIYLDYASTTPVDPRVLEEMLPYFTDRFGNAASSSHLHGEIARKAVERAKAQIADLIKAKDDEIYFTSGATESINLVLKGLVEQHREKRNHIVTVSTEHKAVIDTCAYLETIGTEVDYVNVDYDGIIDWDELANTIRDDTLLVCVMYANNETGVVQDIPKMAELAHINGAFFFTDATQAFGKIPINVYKEEIDLLAFSSHKIYGPKGVGGLFIRDNIKIAAQIHGGGHQQGVRSGTLNSPLIVGAGASARIAKQVMLTESEGLRKLRDQFEQRLISEDKISVNGHIQKRLPNISNIQLMEWEDAEEFILQNRNSISVSTGSACNSEVLEYSHVLRQMGRNENQLRTSIRISYGRFLLPGFDPNLLIHIISQVEKVLK